jgi:alpha-tubulin suppressor-like RCC1 family protein
VSALASEGLRVVAVACGLEHTLALTREGNVWSWGSGEYGATGLGDLETKTVPWIIQTGLVGRKVTASKCPLLGRFRPGVAHHVLTRVV